MKKKVIQNIGLFITLLFSLTIGYDVNLHHSDVWLRQGSHLVYADEPSGTLTPKGEKQIVLEGKDSLGRARSVHIQLQDKDKPTKKRPNKINYDPVGWHNYNFFYGDGKSKAWLMNRGHLVGYQFSGLNDEEKNLVPMTAWLNAGNFEKSDDKNQESMLFYENNLIEWLSSHPKDWLDYKVTAIYTDNELVPRQIRLSYVGLDKSGNLINIKFGADKESVDQYGVTTVVLDNISPNADLNYLDGTATNTVEKYVEPSSQTEETASQESSDPAPAEQPVSPEPETPTVSEPVQPESAESRTVYVARLGKADVYWYDKSNMPRNTNWGNVIEMSEAEAQAQGKRHTMKE